MYGGKYIRTKKVSFRVEQGFFQPKTVLENKRKPQEGSSVLCAGWAFSV